jgi:hypothetical protein
MRTAPPKNLTALSLTEYQASTPSAIDIEGGVIRGVKVLGPVSRNGPKGRRYTEAAMREAVPLYEGIGVNSGHPTGSPSTPRDPADRIGWIKNVTFKGGSLYGDLHLLLSDPLSLKIIESAQKRPELFGLSPNHDVKSRIDRDGVMVIESIVRVRSVDVVPDAGTTRSLYEHEEPRPMKITVQSLFESVANDPAAPRDLRISLLEMGDSTGKDAEMDAPAEETDPLGKILEGFHAACSSRLRPALEGDDGALKDITDWIKKHRKMSAKKAHPEEGAEGEKKTECAMPAKESEQPAPALAGVVTITEARAKTLCKVAGVLPKPGFLAALTRLDDDGALAMVESFKEELAANRAPVKPSGAKSAPLAGAGPVTRTKPGSWIVA